MAAWTLVFCPTKRQQRLIVVLRRCCFPMRPRHSHYTRVLRNAAQPHSDANSGSITWQRWGMVITLKAHEHGRQTDTTQLSQKKTRTSLYQVSWFANLASFYLALTGSFHLPRNKNKSSSPNFNIWIPLILILHRLIKIPLLWIAALITSGLALTNCRSFLPTIWSTSYFFESSRC